jgi:hypothetical protein
MISMEASTYQQTPLSEKKAVSGVPTVLYVNKQGEIVEIDKPRDTAIMTEVIRNSSPPAFTQVLPVPSSKPMSMAAAALPSGASCPRLPPSRSP